MFKPYRNNGSLDISKPQLTGSQVIAVVRPLIKDILQQLKNGTLNYSSFPFTKVANSGLTGKSGVYLILNIADKKIYLGSSNDLAQRKGEHNYQIGKLVSAVANTSMVAGQNQLTSKLNPGIAAYIKKVGSAGSKNLYYIPVYVFGQSQVTGFCLTSNVPCAQQISSFLEEHVERSLIASLQITHANDLYPMKIVGPMQKGNTYGGSPNSGKASIPIAYTTTGQNPNVSYAWESKSAAAQSLDVERKNFSLKTKAGVIKTLTQAEYNQFVGLKISNIDAKTFFNNNTQAKNALIKELFPRAATTKQIP